MDAGSDRGLISSSVGGEPVLDHGVDVDGMSSSSSLSPCDSLTRAGREMGRRNQCSTWKEGAGSASASACSKKRSFGSPKDDDRSNSNSNASEHENHIWTERERRKRMRLMFSTLHSLLPHLAPKTDKSSIVDEAIGYIKSLEQSLQVLQNEKEKTRPYPYVQEVPTEYNTLQTWSSPNVVLSVCGEDAQIGICTVRRPGQLAAIFSTLDKHNVEVITAQISGDSYRCMYMIHVHVAKAVPATEAFKLVTGDLICIFGDYSSY